jgi:hypothetical protein
MDYELEDFDLSNADYISDTNLEEVEIEDKGV